MTRQIAKWAEATRRKKNLTQSDIGRALGISQPQAHKRLINEIEFSLHEITILERLFNEPAPFRDQPAPTTRFGGLQSVDRHAWITVSFVGSVQAGVWVDRANEAAHEMGTDVPASANFPAECQRAYTVVGDSINKIASHGAILVAVEYNCDQCKIEPKDNDLAIVERSRLDGRQIEITAQRLRKTTKGIELWPESEDPRFQDPASLEDTGDDEKINIVAKVIWIINKP